MALGQKPRVYRLQGIPSDLRNADEVSWYLSEHCPDLAGYDIQICSLAKALVSVAPLPWVATVMFHPQKPCDDVANCSPGVDPIEAISKAKNGLIIDEHFLGVTPFNDVGLDDYAYDCIAVSGIGSHPFGSWQAHESDKQFMWIRDIIPKLFPSSRTMIYGYDTELCNTHSFQQIQDLAITLINHLHVVLRSSPARRSIVLIAHSLGGIVVKQALVMLAQGGHPAGHLLVQAISGALFFGVPNHGMVISHLLALASGQPNNVMIEQIKENAPFLDRLESKFSRLLQEGYSFRHKNFFWGYETQESVIPVRSPDDGKWTTKHPDALRLKLVERDSATRGLWADPKQHHFTFQINKDHSSMVKFANAHDPNLTVIIRKLNELFESPMYDEFDISISANDHLQLVRRSTTGIATELSTPPPRSTISEIPVDGANPFKLPSESPNIPELMPLYGRTSELATLAQILDGDATNSRLAVSVHGASGIGKTRLVAHYITNHRDAYDNVFYIDGSNLDRTRLTIRREANRIRQSWSQLFFSALRSGNTHASDIERFCGFLNSEGNTKWLLVIDEMKDSPWITSIFDQLRQGTVILLSTSSQFSERFPSVQVGHLDIIASEQWLLSLGYTCHHGLPSRLDYHPTLIRLAAPQIMRYKTLSTFLNHWRDGDIKLPHQTLDKLNDILQDEFGEVLPESQKEILNICLLFDYKAISYEFLEYIGISDLEPFFCNTIEHLARHGLVERRLPDRQSVTCSFSELLYQFLRHSVTNWDSIVHKVARLLAEKVPRSHKDNYQKRIELLAPHATTFSNYLHATQKPISSSSTELIDNLERIASLLRLLDKDVSAIKLYNLIHQKNAKLPGHKQLAPLQMAELYNNMGLSFMNEGDVRLAHSCFEKAKDAIPQVSVSQRKNETRLRIIANIARALIEMEEYATAESLLSTNLESNKSMSKYLLIPLQHSLGVVHVQTGHADLGISMLEECRSVDESVRLRVGKRVMFTIMHDLATALRDQKKWDDAIALYEKTRECRERFHGPTHRHTMETTAALAVAYQGIGQTGKAAACFREALRWQREKLRLNHPDTLQTLQNYGTFLNTTGDLEGAKKALRLAYTGWVDHGEKIKKTTWNQINSGVSLAVVLRDPTDFSTAETLYDAALAWYREKQKTGSPRIIHQYSKTIYLSGRMYEAVGRADLARTRYDEIKNVPIDGNDGASYWRHRAIRAMRDMPRTADRDPKAKMEALKITRGTTRLSIHKVLN